MPAFVTIAIPELLLAATRLFTGSRDNPEIAADLAPFGYTAKSAEDGLALVAEIRDAIKTQSTEEIEKILASKASFAATAEARAAYAAHRQRAARAYPRGTAGHSALDLAGTVSDAEVPMLAEARTFHEALQTTPALLEDIRGLSAKDVDDALALVTTAEDAEGDQTEETGESERASAQAAVLVARLRATAARTAADAKDALRAKPQLREVLGLAERGT